MPCSGPVQYLCIISETIFAPQSVASLHGEEYRLDARGCSCPVACHAHCPHRFVKSGSNEVLIINWRHRCQTRQPPFRQLAFPVGRQDAAISRGKPGRGRRTNTTGGRKLPHYQISSNSKWLRLGYKLIRGVIYLADLGHGQCPSSIYSFIPCPWALQRNELVNSLLPTALVHLLSAHRRRSCNQILVQEWISGLWGVLWDDSCSDITYFTNHVKPDL